MLAHLLLGGFSKWAILLLPCSLLCLVKVSTIISVVLSRIVKIIIFNNYTFDNIYSFQIKNDTLYYTFKLHFSATVH